MSIIAHAIASLIYLFAGVIALLMARKSLSSGRLLPFHETASGVDWDSLAPGMRSVLLALLKSTGLGFLVVGMVTVLLSALETRRVLRMGSWDPLVVSLGAILPLIFCLGLARINYRLMRETGARTPWKGSLYAAAALLVALLSTALCGCTTSSVLSDSEQEYPWLPAHTSYNRLIDQCAGTRVALALRDGKVREGFLVRATRDSVWWCAEQNLDPAGCATADLARISEPHHLFPEMVGAVCGTCFGAAVGFGAALPQAQSGGAHPVSPPDGPIYVGAAAGAVAGYFVGRGFSTWHEYEIDTLAVRHARATGGTQ